MFAGTAEGSDPLACSAEAALAAVKRALDSVPVQLDLREAGSFEAFGNAGVMVVVRFAYRDQIGSLIGFAQGGEDPARAAALSVLNATNRFLSL